MRYFTMTFPAHTFGCMYIPVFKWYQRIGLRKQCWMATDTILMNHPLPCIQNSDNLRFHPQCKHCCMTYSIFCFEKVFIENIVMWNVTFVASCILTMWAMAPGCVLWCHYVAVDTSFRIVGEIGVCLADVKKEKKQTQHDSWQDQYRKPPGFRRDQFNKKFHGWMWKSFTFDFDVI